MLRFMNLTWGLVAAYILTGTLPYTPTLQADEKAAPAEVRETTEAAADVVLDEAVPDAETAKLLEQLKKDQEEATKSLQKVGHSAAYQQEQAIHLEVKDGKILGFCVLPNGNLAVLAGEGEAYGSSTATDILSSFLGSKPAKVTSGIRWLDAEGKMLQRAELDFTPKAINAAADGSVFVVGEGKIARFDAEGKKIAQEDSPHVAEAIKNREQFEEEVWERHQESIVSAQEYLEQLTESVKEVEAKPVDQQSKTEKRQAAQMRMMLRAYEQSLKQSKEVSREKVVEQALTKMKELHRVAVSKQDVFVVTNEASGYGFCVWRLTHELKEPKKVLTKLAGCCGQMDVQIAGEGLAIAENSRHRVLLVDRDGKTTGTFGETSRTDVTKGFGGCCNPMNTCVDPDGCLLTSESNGLVKRYKLNGDFQDVVGVAKVSEGCKNSSIGISPKGNRLYYFDVLKGEILVLNKAS